MSKGVRKRDKKTEIKLKMLYFEDEGRDTSQGMQEVFRSWKGLRKRDAALPTNFILLTFILVKIIHLVCFKPQSLW